MLTTMFVRTPKLIYRLSSFDHYSVAEEEEETGEGGHSAFIHGCDSKKASHSKRVRKVESCGIGECSINPSLSRLLFHRTGGKMRSAKFVIRSSYSLSRRPNRAWSACAWVRIVCACGIHTKSMSRLDNNPVITIVRNPQSRI